MSIVGFGRISVTKIENGTDAYSTFLSGYSFSVPTDSSLVVSELTSQTIQVYACKGETQINDFTIGKVTAPAELTVSVNNANKTVTLTANKGIVMSSSRAEIEIPIEITDVGSVIQVISFSCTIRGDDGVEGIGYSVIMDNESHLFEGGANNALAGSVTAKVIAYKNKEQVTSTIKSVDGKTISGNSTVNTTVTGLSATVSNNGTLNSAITFKATTNLTTKSKAIPVVIDIDGKTFSKHFSYSIAFKGDKGDTGVSASYVTTVVSSQIFKAESDSTVYIPDESVITPTLTNCTFTSWEYSLDGGANWTTAVSGTNGITISTVKGKANCLTISSDSGLFNTTNVIPFRINCSNGASDTVTIARLRDGNKGEDGVSPGLVTITAKGGQAFVEKKNGKSYSPSSISLTPAFQNCEYSKWQYSLDPENDSSWVDVVSGTHSMSIGSNTKVLTISPNSDLFADDVNAITFKVLSSEDGLTDVITIARVKRGIGYTILLSNESYTFSGTTTHAIAETIPVEIIGYWNSEVLPVTITSIGSNSVSEDTTNVSTGITGLSADVSGNGTMNCVITFKATTSLTQKSGVVEIGILFDGENIVKKFSYSVSMKGDPGKDGEEGTGYTVLLSNESHQFEGTETTAKAGSTTTTVVAYKNTTKSAVTITSIDGKSVSGNTTVSTTVNGLSATVSNNGSTTADTTIKFTTTTSLTTASKAIPIVLTVDGKTFTKYFSYSIAFKGDKGDTGASLYTWLKYADTPTSGMSDSPDGKKYIGLAYNKTSATESTNYSDYTWSLIKGEQGVPGDPGPDGKSLYTWVKYADDAKGTGMSDSPDGKEYIGLAYNKTTATESTTASDYTWSLIKGEQGVPGEKGETGNGISSVTEYYAVSTSNSTAPTSWQTTIQTITATNKYLWNYEKITYTDGTTKDTAKRIIGVYGDKGNTGATGNGIKSIVNHYLASASNSGVTTSTSGWTETIQTVTSSKKYLWNYETITYTDNTVTTTTPCIIGVYGDKGDTGATGNGIKGVTNYYLATSTSSGVTTSTSGWTIDVQSVSAGKKYLWNYEVITYTDNTTLTTTPCIIGAYGDKGATGATGVSVTSVDVQYYLSTSSSTPTGGSWTTDTPTWVNGKYMWSKTVVTYSDTTSTESNPVCITGAKGNTGSAGTNGTNGTDGKGVKSIVEQYYQSTSATALSGGSWTTTYPGWVNGKYIWTRSVITYTDNTTTTTTAVCVTGSKGATGATGAAGKGIKDITEYYAVSTSNSTAPTSWQTTIQPMTSSNKYLWNYEKITYTDDTTFTSAKRIIGVYGDKGDKGNTGSTGVGISAVTNYYLATSSSSGVTTSTSGWTTSVQSVTPTKKYLWNYEVITYTDSTTKSTSPCIIGVYGDKGDKGDKGATGNGISSITEHYAVSNSNSTAPTSWQTTVPSMSASNKYLWNYEKITYTDGTTKDTAKRVIGVYGDKGDAGVSVTSVDVQYYQSTSSTSLSGGSWSTTAPTWVNGKYIWTKTVIKYSNSTTPVETNPVCITGAKGNNGSDGKSITSIVEEYYQSTSSTSLSGGSWSTTAPTWVNGKYIWTRSVINYSTGSPTTTAAICVTGSKGNSGTAGVNTATVFLYQRATSTPAVPSSTLTYTFSTRALSGTLGSWAKTIPSGSNPIYITSASVSANTATASIATSAWSTPVVLAKNGATGATGTSVNSIVTLYYASTSIDTPTPTPTAPSVSSNTISYGSWTDDPTEVDWSGKYVFTMTLVAFKSASGTITIDCSDATYDKTWEVIKRTNTGMVQNSEMIGLIASKSSTGSALILTEGMIAAITPELKIKAPDGTTTIIEGGKINANTIVGTNGSVNFSAGTFTYGNTTKGISWNGTNLNIYGAASISGELKAATGTFAGSLSAATGTFSGELKAATGTFTGEVTATSGSFNGSVTATSLTVTKTIQMHNAACNATLPVLQFGDDRSLYIGGTQDQQTFTDIGVWGNITVSGQVGANYLYGDSGISTNGTVAGSSFIASGGTFKGVKTANAVTTLGYGTNNDYCPTISLLAYWNGAYSGTASNLAYCNRGAFGTIVTKSTSDYAPASHNHSIANITNLQSTLNGKSPNSHVHTQMATTLQVYYYGSTTMRYVICTGQSGYYVDRIWAKGTKLKVSGMFNDSTTLSTYQVTMSSSDIRLKENIKDCTIEALPVIDQMKMKSFDWKGKTEDKHQDIGVVADQLQELDPKLAVGGGYDEDGQMEVKCVDVFYLSGYLIKGEQELHAKIKELQSQNEEKDKKINSLESTIQDLLNRVVQLESK